MVQTVFVTGPTRQRGPSSIVLRVSVVVICCLAALSISLGYAGLERRANPDAAARPSSRRPVALALVEDGRWLFVATQRGTICAIDALKSRLVGETSVGRKLSDIAVTPDGNQLLAADEDAGELLILSRRGSNVQTSGRVKVSPTPVSVQVAPDGRHCTVASLWSRQLSVIALGKEPRVIHSVDLPFAPRKQLLVSKGTKAVVADAFGGNLAVVDVESGTLESVRALPVHNMHGIALVAVHF